MALAYLVYPGAVHTRLLHSLGAYHLMCQAITELKNKGTEISFEEELAVKAGILLHDIGHGPFSHALENVLTPGINHEEIGLQIMHKINEELNGELSLTIKIFTNNYHKKFLHQLISSQLDVDRMDYLTRDSFFTGVSEGVIGYSRILKMLIVHNGELMIEEKGIYSVEKFLVARRQMYWQVYLHKTVLAAEKMLIKIIERAKEIYDENDPQLKTNSSLDFFLQFSPENINTSFLNEFCMIDDTDVIAAIKRWSLHPDTVLSLLCNSVLNRNLFKCKLLNEPINEDFIIKKRKVFSEKYNVSIEESAYFIFSGDAENSMYKPGNEHINIFFKDETVKEISQIENALIHQTISAPVKKFYICELQ